MASGEEKHPSVNPENLICYMQVIFSRDQKGIERGG